MPTRFRAAWIAIATPSREQGPAVRFGPWRADGAAAKADARRELDAGRASMCLVVRDDGDGPKPLAGSVLPQSARKVIRHWEEIWALTEAPPRD